MKAQQRHSAGRSGLELLEEAVHLLRREARSDLTTYYTGSAPFILGLLYFWADLSRSPAAAQHLLGAALGMAGLFIWMKFWQAWFANQLRARLNASPPPALNLRRALRVLVIQTAVQPSALLVLPLALLPAGAPFPWAYAFYQNLTALTPGENGDLRGPCQRAWRQMQLWPGQNVVIQIMLGVFSLVVLLNLASVLAMLPHLLKMGLGMESVYTQSPTSLFNSTFAAGLVGLTYLAIDPIAKTVYLLRCHYGEARQTGADLTAELAHLGRLARPAGALGLGWLILAASLAPNGQLQAATESAAPPAVAEPAAGPRPPGVTVPGPQLDQAINEVLRQSKYAWRLPRANPLTPDSGDNPVIRFCRGILDTLGGWVRDAYDWIADHLDRWLGRRSPPAGRGGSLFDGSSALLVLLFGLLAVVLCAVAILGVRAWQRRRRPTIAVSTEPLNAVPDLTDENVGADQLPEDGWSRLGRELRERGELRLALRAFYFASLAALAGRNLLTIAKFKSNRDYERELGRRAHALPDLCQWFGENVAVFDRSWYGLREVDPELVTRFLHNLDRIKAA